MRTFPLPIALALLASMLTVQAQGPLAPPGPPGPTMKSLDQVEARTPLTGPLPITIDKPGSYYLTGNLNGVAGQANFFGITVTVDHVTIDLNGFRLAGPGNTGIRLQDGVANVAIRNGTIRAWSNAGIAGADSSSVLVENIIASENGFIGIKLGQNAVIQSCTSRQNGSGLGGLGIGGEDGTVISKCVVTGTTGSSGRAIETGLGSLVVDCTVRNNNATNGSGISVGAGTSVVRCAVTGNFGYSAGIVTASHSKVVDCVVTANSGPSAVGIKTGARTEVRNCTASQNGSDGIAAILNCVLIGNTATQNGGDGIQLLTFSRAEGNNVASNASAGIRATGEGNLVIRNSATANNPNFVIAAGNAAGPLVPRADVATSANPNANFVLD